MTGEGLGLGLAFVTCCSVSFSVQHSSEPNLQHGALESSACLLATLAIPSRTHLLHFCIMLMCADIQIPLLGTCFLILPPW